MKNIVEMALLEQKTNAQVNVEQESKWLGRKWLNQTNNVGKNSR